MGVVGDFVADIVTGGGHSRAKDATAAATRTMSGIQLPDIDNMKIYLDELVSQGELTPEQAEAVLVEQSAMEGMSNDPRLRQAQMESLGGLKEIVDQKGMTIADRGRLEQLKGDLRSEERGQREAILQGARQRGVGGSGLELASQMQNQQASAQRASQMGFDVEAQAQERALQALMQQGQVAGGIRGQDFGEQAQIAQAQDAISKFNAQNQQQANIFNTQTQNQAAAANLENKQRIADQNTQMKNAQQQYNKNLNQVDFENRWKKAGGVAGAYGNEANQANQSGQLFGNLLGIGAGIAGNVYTSKQNKKE